MHWHRYSPDELPWTETDGVASKTVTTQPHRLVQYQLEPTAEHRIDTTSSSLVLLVSGSLHVTGLGALNAADLLWVPANVELQAVANAQTRYHQLILPADLGPAEVRVITSTSIQWQAFDDPEGRPTQPVQVLLDSEQISVLRTRFVPEYSAAEHWHDFDTWYFITDGDMRFGQEGNYATGQIRQVSGGYSYGPEEPGDNGVEFVLVSVGGPVSLHWADLEPAPHGPLI